MISSKNMHDLESKEERKRAGKENPSYSCVVEILNFKI